MIYVKRFELYPKELPTCYTVGFGIEENGRLDYIDTQVFLYEAENKTNEEIVEIAKNKIRNEILAKVNYLNSLSPIIGMEISLEDISNSETSETGETEETSEIGE